MKIKRIAALALTVGLVAAAAPSGASGVLAPVKCTASDLTADGRVFPEPQASATWLRFTDLQCGIFLLEDQYPERIDVKVLGRSASDHPVYDVVLTNEKVPNSQKKHLFILSSIHGNEPAGREGGARVIEDMVDARFMANEPFIKETMDRFVTHVVFPNPDGWVDGDIQGTNDAGFMYSRANNGQPNRDLNRNFPVQGFLRAGNGTLDQPEGRAVDELLLQHADTTHAVDNPAYRGWYLGTDNHGQGPKPVAASGLQIVGQFDYQKSERLAHFADGIEGAMAEYGVLDVLQVLNENTDGAIRPYEWGTLYDILGYSASGSGIDYYNTPGVIDGTGFATEMTGAAVAVNMGLHPTLVNQMWVDSVRAINYTLMRDAVNPPSFTYPVGGKAAYVFDPDVVIETDSNGHGPGNAEIPENFTGNRPDVNPNFKFGSYEVTRMKFFSDLNKYADQPLDELHVPDVLADPSVLDDYDSVVLSDDPMPEAGDAEAWSAALRSFVESGGNLIVTDGAAPVIADIVEPIAPEDITMARHDVGFADFGDRAHALNQGLRGVASQTYDVIPIGYPDNEGEAPNWKVAEAAWTAAGGYTAGTNGTGQTIYGELPLGEGRIRFLGALLPQPTEDYFHPYGLQNYAVTYTGYTLLQNMLLWDNPGQTNLGPE